MRYSEICFFKRVELHQITADFKSQQEIVMHIDNLCGEVPFSRKCFIYKPLRMSK